MSSNTLKLLGDTLAMSDDTLKLLGDTLAMSDDTLKLSSATLAMSGDTLTRISHQFLQPQSRVRRGGLSKIFLNDSSISVNPPLLFVRKFLIAESVLQTVDQPIANVLLSEV